MQTHVEWLQETLNENPMPMTFDEVKQKTADDLREVARLLVVEADAIAAGDLGRMDVLIDKMPGWREVLLLRHEYRIEELEKARASVPAQL